MDATYRLVYEVAAGEGPPDRVEVSQRPPRRRIDVVAADGTADATITDGEATWQCRLEGSWRCAELGDPAVSAALDQAVVDALSDALLAGAEDYEFTVEERVVLGEPARCLRTALRPEARGQAGLGGLGELCLAADGAILAVDTPTGTLRAVEHSPDVADDAFELPAPPDT
ncbi:MAG: hypothetical protein H0W25_15220 [Acidimicrobiia bacterium]|nr:hypothetical protein [Acidimicrobiia bacterium]